MPGAPPELAKDICGYVAYVGEVPYVEPNVRRGREEQDIVKEINAGMGSPESDSCATTLSVLAIGVGWFWLGHRMRLVEQGQLELWSDEKGRTFALGAGRHWITSPWKQYRGTLRLAEDVLRMDTVAVVRVPVGYVGLALLNGDPLVLLPGTHVYKNAGFDFARVVPLSDSTITFGPVALLTVKAGTALACYRDGRLCVLEPGRYAVNCASFAVGSLVQTRQLNTRLENHRVVLAGGVSLTVQGLLTYRVADVEKMMLAIGYDEMKRAILDVALSELCRVFGSVHLEQMMLSGQADPEDGKSVLGPDRRREGEWRSEVCSRVMERMRHPAGAWGVEIHNFQLESTQITDSAYALQYEESSLALSQAKAAQRAVATESEVELQRARGVAMALAAEAEGRQKAALIDAEGRAAVLKLDSEARNSAGLAMTDQFARQYALASLRSEALKGLQAKTLVVAPFSDALHNLGAALLASPGDGEHKSRE